mmetsp:Transcript_131222/g.379594  ORF Transcript_131222/g.379594 Transcript_131222/m.379594 type:complete len:351 (+) Transcript_131222:282-1334(+)
MDLCVESRRAAVSLSTALRSCCISPRRLCTLSSWPCIVPMVGIMTSSCRSCSNRMPSRTCWSALPVEFNSCSALESRCKNVVCSAFSFAMSEALSLILAMCCSASSRRLESTSSRRASKALVCRASVWATRASSLSNLALTSCTSSLSALMDNACSMATLSAFLSNSLLSASRWPMNTDSAMVSMYCRRSASFLSTAWYSAMFTFLLINACSSLTSSLLENMLKHFRLESVNASSSLCSNSWKARPMARRRSVSEIMAFMPLSKDDTTSLCCLAAFCREFTPCSNWSIFFLLKFMSAMGSWYSTAMSSPGASTLATARASMAAPRGQQGAGAAKRRCPPLAAPAGPGLGA